MIILGIESSCDETAAAIINEKKEILAETVFTQLEEHKKYGGVVPEIAARAHLEYIDKIIEDTMKKANVSYNDLDAIAAASGPGLIGGVVVGVMTAKAIALAHNKPFIAVNHLEGHALSPRISEDVKFPYLLLLVSGGHCQILIVKGPGDYERLGTTIDDAAGEAYDKVSKMLGLGYPGGPIIEKMAKSGDENRFSLPRPLKGKDGCNLSFSGLKTAVRKIIETYSNDNNINNVEIPDQDICDICASFQLAVTESLTHKLQKAIDIFKEKHPDGKDIVVGGGVAANQFIRNKLNQLAKDNNLIFSAPPIKLCTDNGTMIAWAGLERFRIGIQDNLNFKPRPRWPLDDTAPKARGAGIKA
jgi:N6-L-threonylcarbamoyladenine synthase